MKLFHLFCCIALAVLVLILLVTIGARAEASAECAPPSVSYDGLKVQEQIEIPQRYSEADVEAMAVMLAGECYPWDTDDMRCAAITVCNRVDSPKWSQNTVEAVIRQTGYYGYDAHNAPTKTHYKVARQVLDDWCAVSVGIDRPWQPWLFFSAVNGTNIYRTEY